jgi:APA family basic amino acid/polyamine antiporter
MSKHPKATAAPELSRVVGIPGAVLMGLGSILGTGIFVSIGIAAGIAGASVVAAVVLAAAVATFNGLSSAQLAASHPVSGGSYEYGYRYLSPALGFTAGFMFLCAKSASAATAALGFAGYVLVAFGASTEAYRVSLAVAGVFVLTVIVAGGMQRSNRANTLIVSFTLLALLGFVVCGLPTARAGLQAQFADFRGVSVREFLRATALMFVAYTGYGRIATLGEEIRDPRTKIPKAIVLTLVSTATLYAAVAFVAVAAVGPARLVEATEQAAAPLALVARSFEVPGLPLLVAVGAITAMLGVLLNLLLGLSRVVLAMARRGDLPKRLSHIDAESASPRAAVVLVGAAVTGLAAIGSVKTTWSFSAFTVLVYYALTNLAALRLPREARLYPPWVPAMGLMGCLGLAFWVEPRIWGAGLASIALGLLWHRFVGGGRTSPSTRGS